MTRVPACPICGHVMPPVGPCPLENNRRLISIANLEAAQRSLSRLLRQIPEERPEPLP